MEPLVSFFGGDEECREENSHMINDNCFPDCLPPECDEGNVEYKLKLVNPTQSRFEHLVTQMKWRLREGHGEAIYEIGVEDKGILVGLSEEEADCSLRTLYMMAEKLGATLTVLREKRIGNKEGNIRKVCEVLIRKIPDNRQSIELRVAVLGNVDVGKSTLLGVLTQGELDNGRGSARLNLFRHRHEIQTGRTSSISREILGFDASGNPVTYSSYRTPEEICEASSKLVTFIDLAGHQKYLKTTIFGLMSHLPHVSMLVVNAISGIVGTTKEHLGLAKALDLPFIIIVNKIDLALSDAVKSLILQLEDLLRSYEKHTETALALISCLSQIPLRIKTKDDAIIAASSMFSNIAPIFTLSCVKGSGLKFLYTFLNVLPPCLNNKERDKIIKSDAEFQIDETFRVMNVGIVVGGLLTSGIIKEGEWIKIGPLSNGNFSKARIASIYRYKVPSRVVRAGESATLALSNLDSSVMAEMRKGMVIIPHLSKHRNYPICYYFQARIHVLSHPTTLSPGFQASVHIGNVYQTAVIVAIMGKHSIATNDVASVMFKFIKRPEYIQPGTRMLFREGQTKCIGHILQIFPITGNFGITVDENNN